MKAKIVLLSAVFLFGLTNIFAQTDYNHGLILKGRIYDGTKEEFKDYVIWRAKLAMEFVNTGNRPIILLNPQRQFGQWQNEVRFSRDKNYEASKQFKFSKNIERTIDPEQLKHIAKYLDDERPSENLVVIINPNESLIFDDVLEVKQNFTKAKYGKIWEGTRSSIQYWEEDTESIDSLRYLIIKYEISLIKYQVEPDLLEKLQAKWLKYGILPVDTNGGFSIISEPIEHRVKYETIKEQQTL